MAGAGGTHSGAGRPIRQPSNWSLSSKIKWLEPTTAGMWLNCILRIVASRLPRDFLLKVLGENRSQANAQALCYASQRAAQGPVETRVKCLHDGSWIVSPPLIQQASLSRQDPRLHAKLEF